MAITKNTSAKAATPDAHAADAPVAKAKPAKAAAKAEPAEIVKPVKAKPIKAAPVAAEKAPKAPKPAKEAAPVVETPPAPDAPRLTRKDLAQGLREKVMASGLAVSPKVAEVMSVAFEEVVTEALAAGMVVPLAGFGVFSVVAREATTRPNPQKPGEKINVPAHNVPKFKAGAKLKAALNGGAEHADVGSE